MANEPKYKVGDVIVSQDGIKRTVSDVIHLFAYDFDEYPSEFLERDLDRLGYKLQEPVEEMTLAQVCKELGRTIKIVK